MHVRVVPMGRVVALAVLGPLLLHLRTFRRLLADCESQNWRRRRSDKYRAHRGRPPPFPVQLDVVLDRVVDSGLFGEVDIFPLPFGLKVAVAALFLLLFFVGLPCCLLPSHLQLPIQNLQKPIWSAIKLGTNGIKIEKNKDQSCNSGQFVKNMELSLCFYQFQEVL